MGFIFGGLYVCNKDVFPSSCASTVFKVFVFFPDFSPGLVVSQSPEKLLYSSFMGPVWEEAAQKCASSSVGVLIIGYFSTLVVGLL